MEWRNDEQIHVSSRNDITMLITPESMTSKWYNAPLSNLNGHFYLQRQDLGYEVSLQDGKRVEFKSTKDT